jgi:hypothetical protein
MQYSLCIILCAAFIFCGLAYIRRQCRKRIAEMNCDAAIEVPGCEPLPDDFVSVKLGDGRCCLNLFGNSRLEDNSPRDLGTAAGGRCRLY